jgi:hypothetical protein
LGWWFGGREKRESQKHSASSHFIPFEDEGVPFLLPLLGLLPDFLTSSVPHSIISTQSITHNTNDREQPAIMPRATRDAGARLKSLLFLLLLSLTSTLTLLPTPTLALSNGLGLTPAMGFNTWNKFGCNIDEALVKETAQLLIDTGLRDKGYVYVNLDDCWMERNRTADGRLVEDPVKFPSGLKALGDYLHGLGFKFGIYSSAGYATCENYPASLGRGVEERREGGREGGEGTFNIPIQASYAKRPKRQSLPPLFLTPLLLLFSLPPLINSSTQA